MGFLSVATVQSKRLSILNTVLGEAFPPWSATTGGKNLFTWSHGLKDDIRLGRQILRNVDFSEILLFVHVIWLVYFTFNLNVTFYCFHSVKLGLFQIVQTVELISLYVETWASNFCFLFFSLSFSAPPLFFDIVIWSHCCWCTSLDCQSNREQAWPSGKHISQHAFLRNFWEENKNDDLSLYIFYFYL